jgi:phage/plasmid-associated DNA primase
VLAWAVEGAKEWLRDGLGECKAITDATRNALAKSRSAKRDLFATAVHRFIAECCVVGDQFSESTTAMLPVFTEFATAKGFLAKNDINITAFGRALNDAGYPVGRTPTLGRQKRRQGLKLRDDQRQGAA